MLPTTTDAPKAYTLADCSKKYATSRRQLYREIAAGRLQAVKRGHSTLILADSAEEWFNALPRADFQAAA